MLAWYGLLSSERVMLVGIRWYARRRAPPGKPSARGSEFLP
jgi:hypothetical protein